MIYDLSNPIMAAAGVARDLYGLSATVLSLPGEYDLNFLLRADDGREFILKIMRAGDTAPLVDMQIAALDHLAQQDPTLPVQRVVPAADGRRRRNIETAANESRLVWMLTFTPGPLLAQARPQPAPLLESLGRLLGRFDAALADFDHPAAHRELLWDLKRAGWISDDLELIADPDERAIVAYFTTLFRETALPLLERLPHSVIHGDPNDYNIVVNEPRAAERRAVALIDLGDTVFSATITDLAIAAAYALLDKADPLAAAAAVVTGFHASRPLDKNEIAVLYPLIAMRLCVSVTVSARRGLERPDDPYATVSESAAWDALKKLRTIHPRLAHYTLRHACRLVRSRTTRPSSIGCSAIQPGLPRCWRAIRAPPRPSSLI